nr:hypothetical protein [Candidatus Sigynarchaeota archaeon]
YAKQTIPSPLMGGVREHVVYDTAILALLKTLVFSQRLSVFLNEADPVRYKELEDLVDDITTRGLRVFVKNTHNQKTLNLMTGRFNKVKDKIAKMFPDGPQDACPAGYHEEYIQTKATIKCYPCDISESMPGIIKKLLPKKSKSSRPKPPPLSLFVIEPRGLVDVKFIADLCAYQEQHGGAEMLLGVSHVHPSIIDDGDGTGKKLRSVWKYVVETGPDSKDGDMHLVVCTDHKASATMAGYNPEIKKDIPHREKFKSLMDFSLKN